MDSRRTEQVALLSIKPEYALAIMEGKKRVEFRKKRLRADVRTVVVYASAPIQRVIGSFTIAQVEEGAPEDLWARYHEVGAIRLDAYREYFSNSAQAVAIGVGAVRRLPSPVPLSVLGPDLVPPQSFRYLDAGSVNAVLDRAADLRGSEFTKRPLASLAAAIWQFLSAAPDLFRVLRRRTAR